jgi:hypothetical protein
MAELIQITSIRTVQSAAQELITDVQWRCGSASTGQCTVEGLIAWLGASEANEAVVADGFRSIPVRVVRSTERPPYLCACSEEVWTDALLALPRF